MAFSVACFFDHSAASERVSETEPALLAAYCGDFVERKEALGFRGIQSSMARLECGWSLFGQPRSSPFISETQHRQFNAVIRQASAS